MANEVALVATEIGLVHPLTAKVRSFVAVAAITKGQGVYVVASTGKVDLVDANDSGKQQFRGIALQTVAAGETVDVCQRGEMYGFTVSGLSYDDPIYVSDTPGALSTAVGTLTVIAARVVPVNDKDLTKVLYIEVDLIRIWA